MCVGIMVCGFFTGWAYGRLHPVVDLPEEYRLIKPTDTLKGYWQDNVLHIEFNNSNNK
jgi:hypothetical protein